MEVVEICVMKSITESLGVMQDKFISLLRLIHVRKMYAPGEQSLFPPACYSTETNCHYWNVRQSSQLTSLKELFLPDRSMAFISHFSFDGCLVKKQRILCNISPISNYNGLFITFILCNRTAKILYILPGNYVPLQIYKKWGGCVFALNQALLLYFLSLSRDNGSSGTALVMV